MLDARNRLSADRYLAARFYRSAGLGLLSGTSAMSRNYYSILGVERSAHSLDIKAGYKWQAMKWHPQKNPSAKVEAEQRFRDIAEAYDVLIDPVQRGRFDEFGEKGLKFPPAGSGFPPYQYVGDPFALFVDFFAAANPLKPAYDISLDSVAPSLATMPVGPNIEVEVQTSLQELQDGITKRIVVGRTRLGPNGQPYQESKAITLPIRPGWQAGMRVTFRGEGNHTRQDQQAGELIFVLVERPFPKRLEDQEELEPQVVAG